MNEINQTNESKKVYSVLKMGAEMFGGMASTAAGLITISSLGPMGVVLLGGLGAGISKLIVDVTERQLSKRELTRMGGTAYVGSRKYMKILNQEKK